MRGMLIGAALALMVSVPMALALRIERPPEFPVQWDSNRATQLNNYFLNLWNILNGRYQADVVTSDPDGTRMGIAGECVYWDTTTDKWCCNATGTQRSPTTVWRCADMS